MWCVMHCVKFDIKCRVKVLIKFILFTVIAYLPLNVNDKME